MLARRVFSFYPPRLHASSCFPSNPFVSPTSKITVCNSFVSPTYAKTGGCTPPKMSVRRHSLSLFSQSPLSALLLFNHLRTLSFSVSYLSLVAPAASALLPQKQGVHPLWSDQSSASAVGCQLSTVGSLLLPFTSRSQSCYRTFTHLSPCLVTMNPGPGSHTNTMPIAISPRTVHFYQCDPLREMPS
jgi:hypothetical protein